MPDEAIPGADVTDIPTPVEPTGSDADIQEPVPDPAQPPAPEKPGVKGFDDLFADAKSKATQPAAADDADDDEETGEGEGEDDAEKPATEDDAKVPSDEEAEEAAEEKPSTAEEAEPTSDKPAKNERGRNFKEVVTQNETLTTENGKLNERLTKLDTQFKQYGGVESVEMAMDTLEKLSSGKALEVVDTLPQHVRTALQQQVFERSMQVPTNRVYGVNHVLKGDFGLQKEISQPLMEKIFEFAVNRLNTDSEDFESFLDRDLEFANTPEKELERVKAENERLKSQPDGKTQEDKPESTETPLELGQRIEKVHDDFEDATFAKKAPEVLKTYGLVPTAKDTPAMKEAKEYVSAAIKAQVQFEMRTAKAFEPLLEFWAYKDTENAYYKQAEANYERAYEAKFQSAMKKISRLFTAKSAAPAPGDPKIPENKQIPAPGGKQQIPTPTPPKRSGSGFDAAFDGAKRSAGVK